MKVVRHLLPLFLGLFFPFPGPASAQELLYNWWGDATSDVLGSSVSEAGDVDGDGVPDVIVGVPFANVNGMNSGLAKVFSGADGSILHIFQGDSASDTFGATVAGGGDVNGDGFADLIVGAPADDPGGLNSGSVQVFSGRDGSLLHFFAGSGTLSFFGVVANAGDVNADGYDDILASTPFDSAVAYEAGLVQVFSGRDGSVLYEFRGQAGGDHLGQSVDGVGDVNGDGYDDFLVGAPSEGSNGGRAHLYSGRDGSVIYTFEDLSTDITLGDSVAGAGDVNGDGVPDVIIGGSRLGVHGTSSGSASVYSGADGSLLYRFLGYTYYGFFGGSVDGAGDVDGDGFADLIVGARREDQGSPGDGSGSARIFSGKNGLILLDLIGKNRTDDFGSSVSRVGDVDGDGRDDVLIGAPGADYVQGQLIGDVGHAYIIGVTTPSFLYLGLEDGNPVAEVRATGLRPNEDAWLFASGKAYGKTWVPGLQVMLDLGGRLRCTGPQRTDAQGEIFGPITIPPTAYQNAVWLQMAQVGLKTNVTGGMPFP